jgi:hypothetical protein
MLLGSGIYDPGQKRALYLPRCLPDGDVVVASCHFFILPENPVGSSSAGIVSIVATALHSSKMLLQREESSGYGICKPSRISSAAGREAVQSRCDQSGLIGLVNAGGPCDCPKCIQLRRRR